MENLRNPFVWIGIIGTIGALLLSAFVGDMPMRVWFVFTALAMSGYTAVVGYQIVTPLLRARRWARASVAIVWHAFPPCLLAWLAFYLARTLFTGP